ncbi:MAG: hypothetical protein ACRCZF_05170, partial [Gemmataceae bacterium]
MIPYSFDPLAAKEIDEALEYSQQHHRLKTPNFRAAIDATVRRVVESPDQYPVLKRPDIREAVVIGYPYQLFYRWDGQPS